MSLPKKGRRTVEVNGACYRWTIRKKPTQGQAVAETPMTLAVEACDGKGKMIVSLGISRPDNWLGPHQTSVTPKVVRQLIEEALSMGWDFNDPACFSFQYQLIKDRC